MDGLTIDPVTVAPDFNDLHTLEAMTLCVLLSLQQKMRALNTAQFSAHRHT